MDGENNIGTGHYNKSNRQGNALRQFETNDLQRDKAANPFYKAYIHPANYAVGVYMAGAGTGCHNPLPSPRDAL
jgi:hypothetical protein